MPTFPSYLGPPLPEVLNPLNPRHYWMLLDWIYFKPSRLKQYLYRADAELYFQRGWRALVAAMRQPAYRNLAVMSLVLTIVLSAFFSVVASWAAPATQETVIQWGGMAFSVAFGMTLGVASGVAFGVAVVTMVGVAVGMAFSVAVGVAFSVAVVTMVGVAVVTTGDAAAGVALSMAVGVGALRGVFYALQVWPAIGQALRRSLDSQRLAHHPSFRDELAVLPFPGLGRLLARALTVEFSASQQVTRHLLRNPFQRWVVGRSFACFLAETSAPLPAFYQALSNPILAEYVVEPTQERDLRLHPPARTLWLGELAGGFVDGTGGASRSSEQMAWWVTLPLRGRPHPQVAPLARFLLHLLDRDQVIEKGPDATLLEAAAEAVRSLDGGEEVALSLTALAQLGAVENLEGISQSREELGWLDRLQASPLRPQVLEGLRGLVDVSNEITRFCQATSPATQAAALNRAVGMLDELAEYVEDIHLPEQALLLRAVGSWKSLVAEAAGRLGEQALREMTPAARQALAGGERQAAFWSRPADYFANPYKAGDPVAPPLFVGRADVFRRIQEVWGGKANPDSIILYGHRRMGKSSILRNLEEYAPPGSLLVYADLKGETAFAEGTHFLLRGLADAVTWAAERRSLDVPNPDPAEYTTPAEASQALRRILHRVLAALPDKSSLILALDEFEGVDAAVQVRKIGSEIYDYLRSLSQEPRIVLVFAGLHTLDEMSRDYQAAFFGSYHNIRVSYLPSEAAERLIARPTPDFSLNYHPDVIRRIIRETNGQALLVQRICQELVNHVNYELFDQEREREARVLPEDLEAVLSDEFVRSETRYFDGIWNDQVAGRAAAEAVLRVLREGPADAGSLCEATGLSEPMIAEALGYLKARDLISLDVEGQCDLRVPLMRRWLQLREG